MGKKIISTPRFVHSNEAEPGRAARTPPPPPGNRERHLRYQQHHLPLVKEHVIPANLPFDSLHETPMMQEPREGSVVTRAHAHTRTRRNQAERVSAPARAHVHTYSAVPF